ncbi:spore germination protein [Tumebacillus sp. DT12]|uniref:Spore germination protein n=1 Tax=Tumebacillus lacus TaxID=2995335 RepID=A0ABT3WZE5_9BACL|nr:spore germination protein [Tumebacillus lacus]MCX7569093.1 spore germination protein [Tumebacillus lacus]
MAQIKRNTDIPPTKQELPLEKKLSENLKFFERALGIGKSFDMINREMTFAGHDFAFLYINGFVKDNIVDDMLRSLSHLKREQIAVDTVEKLFHTYLGHTQVELVETSDKVVAAVLTGQTAVLIDGFEKAFLIDARTFPARSPQEPELERVVRGSRDGYVETLVHNTVLTRRRIRDPRLRFINMKIGTRSMTDIAIAYLEDVADDHLVEEIRTRLSGIEVDGLPMAEKTVEEWLTQRNRWNPYPLVRYTERPDVAAVHLLEGHILIFVDTSPSVMITPATFFHHVQHAEEFRENPMTGLWVRWVRFLGIFASLFFIPMWILFTLIHREWLPAGLAFLGPDDIGAIPIILQFLFAELGIDLMRMAAIHTPTPLATAMGLIAAVLIGDIAVKVGLFAPETILYLAVAAIGMFATPSYELSMANRITRVFFVLSVAFLDWYGLAAAFAAWFIILARTKSITRPYFWPLVPFNLKALLSVVMRAPVPFSNVRPSFVRPKDKDRQPN